MTPAFSGTVYSSPVDNFFVTNSAAGLIIGYNSVGVAVGTCPDYRNAVTNLLTLTNTTARFTTVASVPSGTNLAPSLAFNNSATTGIYSSAVN